MPKLKKMLKSFKFAYEGVYYFVKANNNFQFHLIATVLVVLASVFLKVSSIEASVLAICVASVLSFEIINTAVEHICDQIHPEQSSLIKQIKDMAAAAVLVMALGAFCVACFIFIPKFYHLLWNH